VLDFDADLYGRTVRLALRRRIRAERAFRSIDALMAAMAVVQPAAAEEAYRPFPLESGTARQLPVLARHGMVVSQEARASQIGVDILKRGGNAVDAAVAVGFALAVTLPRAGNIGGGGFMLIHLEKTGENIAIDYREMAPADTPKTIFLDDAGNFVPGKSQQSALGIGVPGTVAGLALAHKAYGSGKLTLADLIAPAIALARDGLIVDDTLSASLATAAPRLTRYPASRAIFLNPDGSAPAPGTRLFQPELAATLQAIADGGPGAFYRGQTGEKIAASVQRAGGRMTAADVAAYTAVVRPVVIGTYRGHTIVSMPPPSSGGIHVIQILNMLEAFPIADLGLNSAATLHLMAEAMKRAYADRSEYLGDPDFVKIPVKQLISKSYAEELRGTISQDRATPSAEVKPGKITPSESDQTTHFSAVDAEGNGVANTYTLNFYYGSALVAEGTGVLLNNELDDFAAKPDAPNAFGLTGGEANAPGPRKRPLSSMSPTIVLKDGALEMVTGSPGGSRIISTVVQVILNGLDHGLNAAEAVDAPRMHHQWQPDELRVEQGISADTLALLKAKGHALVPSQTMGLSQTIFRKDGVLSGAADPRQRNAAVAGY